MLTAAAAAFASTLGVVLFEPRPGATLEARFELLPPLDALQLAGVEVKPLAEVRGEARSLIKRSSTWSASTLDLTRAEASALGEPTGGIVLCRDFAFCVG